MQSVPKNETFDRIQVSHHNSLNKTPPDPSLGEPGKLQKSLRAMNPKSKRNTELLQYYLYS